MESFFLLQKNVIDTKRWRRIMRQISLAVTRTPPDQPA
jgi:hypothetical protein